MPRQAGNIYSDSVFVLSYTDGNGEKRMLAAYPSWEAADYCVHGGYDKTVEMVSMVGPDHNATCHWTYRQHDDESVWYIDELRMQPDIRG